MYDNTVAKALFDLLNSFLYARRIFIITLVKYLKLHSL